LALINYCQAPLGPLTTLALTNALTFGNPPGQRVVAVAFSLNDLFALIIGGVLYKVKGVHFETLERICEALECQPGDILEFRPGES
jgi:hypothetical protein